MENEFGVVAKYADGRMADFRTGNTNSIAIALIPHSVKSVDDRLRLWHSNGGCTYVDTGEHPEHATPECRYVRDAVLYNKAGEYLAAAVFGKPNREGIAFLLFKNNLGYNANTHDVIGDGQYGCHENYLIYKNYISGAPNVWKPLISFLATRQIFDGAGWWEHDGKFHYSQRARCIISEFDGTTVSNRPFFGIKTADTGNRYRLHVICGDANICEFALYLKLGTTSLALALFEADLLPKFMCVNPAEALHAISRTADPFSPYLDMQDCSQMSAFEIQTAILERIRKELPCAMYADERIEAEVKHIADCWEQALNAIYNRDEEWMRGRIDYATKQYLTSLYVARTAERGSLHAVLKKELDILYHDISDRRLQDVISARWPERRIVSDDEIGRALLSAPQDTRARMRGMFVETLRSKEIDQPHLLNWRTCGVYFEGEAVDLPDGLVSHESRFDQFLAGIMPK